MITNSMSDLDGSNIAQIVVILVASGWGILSDRIGRQLTYVAGYALMGLGFYLYPLV